MADTKSDSFPTPKDVEDFLNNHSFVKTIQEMGHQLNSLAITNVEVEQEGYITGLVNNAQVTKDATGKSNRIFIEESENGTGSVLFQEWLDGNREQRYYCEKLGGAKPYRYVIEVGIHTDGESQDAIDKLRKEDSFNFLPRTRYYISDDSIKKTCMVPYDDPRKDITPPDEDITEGKEIELELTPEDRNIIRKAVLTVKNALSPVLSETT